jgi:succinyl-diaminopimelate desuccinylase
MAAVTGDVPLHSITDLLRALVRIPSRAGEDDLDRVCRFLEDWFRAHRVPVHLLTTQLGRRLGLYAEARGQPGPGPWTILDATLDTAGFGDRAAWSVDPSSAEVRDGWLYGRGSADSKAAVSLFSHLIQELLAKRDFAGRIGVLFDCDEHSGHFGGARAFFDHPHGNEGPPRPDGVFIGYPGMDRIVNGCRGFLRSELIVHGIAGHSGASRHRGVNAISRAAELTRRLESLAVPPATDAFPLSPQLTITSIEGGSRTFSLVPDLCEFRLDVRLTPSFPLETARPAIEDLVARFDAESPQTATTTIEWQGGWPAYQVPTSHPLVQSLRDATRDELGAELPTDVVGPSNIGNYLASLGVPALCGFGVKAEGIHAADERIALDSIDPVYHVYRNALRRMHRPSP